MSRIIHVQVRDAEVKALSTHLSLVTQASRRVLAAKEDELTTLRQQVGHQHTHIFRCHLVHRHTNTDRQAHHLVLRQTNTDRQTINISRTSPTSSAATWCTDTQIQTDTRKISQESAV